MTLQSESIAAIVPALILARTEFDPAVKRSTNPHLKTKYVDLEGVLDAVVPALLKNNIVLMQQTDYEDGVTVLFTRLIHQTGEWIGSRYPVKPIKAEPQAEGSALTYARRYTAMAICGIAPEDDDGNTATKPAKESPSPDAINAVVTAFKGAIADADSTESLSRVGASIASADVPKEDRATLRQLFTARMEALKKAAA